MSSDVVKRMVDAADAFLQALSANQRSKAQLDFFDEAERKLALRAARSPGAVYPRHG